MAVELRSLHFSNYLDSSAGPRHRRTFLSRSAAETQMSIGYKGEQIANIKHRCPKLTVTYVRREHTIEKDKWRPM